MLKDNIDFFIFPEDINPDDNHRKISFCTSIYSIKLLNEINKYTKTKGFKLISSSKANAIR